MNNCVDDDNDNDDNITIDVFSYVRVFGNRLDRVLHQQKRFFNSYIVTISRIDNINNNTIASSDIQCYYEAINRMIIQAEHMNINYT